ncbi:Ctr copper transporter family-domain-containing protein [Talaromyces proteolyticus]|uniref:Copper transport protein n=1 Tax=Talaromyces proteolyticus TaxID=1131652 RepID=A0AAD4Q4A1_9EURO|nr:Ctr copper transporter family-domain-containing protein [Talaromyces proteolyticus]KAH8702472.1 Ctr copper transporter family-domain-containing protein [Talaromyces proteolyticus]
MDMSGMTMATASTTASAASSAMTSMSSMSSMDMGTGSCKVSMLWNWDTIDTCFISKSWHITSHGMFAGSCIGVILLVMTLEFLRRLSKEYDRYILQRFKREIALDASYKRAQKATGVESSCCVPENDSNTGDKNGTTTTMNNNNPLFCAGAAPTIRFRPTFAQQSIRALLHMVTFAVAYFVMLLAMYYNGYFIICIFIGAYLGGFVFTWESISIASEPTPAGTAATEEVTVCCG